MTNQINGTAWRVARIAIVVIGSSILAHSQTQSLPSFFQGLTSGSPWDELIFPPVPPSQVPVLFGYFYPYSDSAGNLYITHADLGTEYVIDDGNGGVYLYDFGSSSWLWTNPTSFNSLYDLTLSAWLWYYLDPNRLGHYTSNPRVFYDFALGYDIELGSGGLPTQVPPGVLVPNSLSIAGGGNSDPNITAYSSPPTQASSMVSFAFTYHDSGTASGAQNIAGGYISFQYQGTSNDVCNISWNAAAGGTVNLQSIGPVQPGIIQTDSDCSVSLQSSPVYSTSDPTAVTVTLNIAFSSALGGSYSVISEDIDQQGLYSTQALGSVFIAAPLITLVPPNPVPMVPANGQPTLVTYSLTGNPNLLQGGDGSCNPIDPNIRANITQIVANPGGGGSVTLSVTVSPSETNNSATLDCPCPGGGGPIEPPIGVSPAAQITITSTTTVVSGNNSNSPNVVSVGQQIALTGSVTGLPGGVTVISQAWEIQGTTVANYVQTYDASASTSSAVSTALSKSNLEQPQVTFYWIDGDNGTNTVTYTVAYTATLSDQTTWTATAYYRPVRPSPVTFSGTVTATTPVINESSTQLKDQNDNPLPSLNFGYPDPDYGIQFSLSVTTTFGGNLGYLQLVNVNHKVTLTSGAVQTKTDQWVGGAG